MIGAYPQSIHRVTSSTFLFSFVVYLDRSGAVFFVIRVLRFSSVGILFTMFSLSYVPSKFLPALETHRNNLF